MSNPKTDSKAEAAPDTGPAASAAMPAQPFTWITQYRFYVEGGIVKIAFGENNAYFAAVAMPIWLTVELLSQLGGVVRDQIAPRPPAAPSDAPVRH